MCIRDSSRVFLPPTTSDIFLPTEASGVFLPSATSGIFLSAGTSAVFLPDAAHVGVIRSAAPDVVFPAALLPCIFHASADSRRQVLILLASDPTSVVDDPAAGAHLVLKDTRITIFIHHTHHTFGFQRAAGTFHVFPTSRYAASKRCLLYTSDAADES